MSKNNNLAPLILLSCGGTGGHMTPARALGADLLSRGYRVEMLTDTRGQNFKALFEGMIIHPIASGTLGAGLIGKVKGISKLGIGLVQAAALLIKLRPALVVGFGGYPSVPAVYVAQKMKIPTIIHEQNAIIGRANSFLAAKADRIALSLPEAQGLDDSEKIKAVVTGNPVRPEIAALFMKPYPVLSNEGEMRIFVMGGSLGAHIFSEVIPAALAELSLEYRSRLHIVQQCREADLELTRNAYEAAGIKADLSTFFDDVAGELEKAHLVIGRSGASTVAELTTAGRPAIFVPYPHHKDQQQKINADSVADAGGAWVMTQDGFTSEALQARMEAFLQNPQILFKAAEKARSCGRPDAARKLGNLVTAMVSGWGE